MFNDILPKLSAYPHRVIGDCLLINGDCMEVVPLLGKVDAVVTDPPYGIGFKYASHDDTPDGYGAWLWGIIQECENHCTAGSPVFVFQAMKNIRLFTEWFPRQWRIYAAAKNFVQMRPTPMQYSFDPVVCWWTDGEAWSAGSDSRDFYISNTASVISNRNNIEKGHPCPRPLDQMIRMVGQWARPDGTVLDPFMGSGTTLVACAKMGRKGIGIEIDEQYFEIAVKRVEDAYRQGDMFVTPPPKPTQEKMPL